ncbi:PKD domain-containing protein [Lewinella sp. JB7]|uniref:PKD domain-containing protein n=1 Tax=Lewinella sp. JB7 TaxID=2962887 RepID=UPI0020C939FE|nr:PKD domain-containing protein [Lewinella sp. JB7]MCP9236422.1 PKD domain-containing protein [Lewinella sp. JB7]
MLALAGFPGLELHATPRFSTTSEAFAPTARAIQAYTTQANATEVYVVNGAFEGTGLTYTATLSNGSSLPGWIDFDGSTATFTLAAPSSAVGRTYQIKVTARDNQNSASSSSFYLAVDDSGFSCTVDANTDRLAKLLGCGNGTVRLRGYTSTDTYQWSGPGGFTSTEAEPLVSRAGLYELTTDDGGCTRRSIVEVLPAIPGCSVSSRNNVIPVGRISADRTSGSAPLTVSLDGKSSSDTDGSIIDYTWNWDGGAASGARPVVDFPQGTHQVTLTVTDDTGAKSTDYVKISVNAFAASKSYWLEAECAEYGKQWSLERNGNASGGAYLAPKKSSTSGAPADAAENRVRFVLSNVEAGAYHVFARVDAPNNTSDSYWVRANGGSWYQWNSGIQIDAGYKWNKMQQVLNLRDGNNTIDFAFRETDARLDKIKITTSSSQPSGTGDAATNCTTNEAPTALAKATPDFGVGTQTVTLDGSGSSDADGSITSYAWKWNGGTASGSRPQVTLVPGNYSVSLTVTDNDGATDTDVIAVQLSAETTTPNGNEFWLEAECAQVGKKWSVQSSTSATNGSYVVVRSGNAYTSAPSDVADNRVRFEVNASAAGSYKLFARIDAPSNLDDSYWVRVNGGSWYRWSSGMTQGKGFQWNKMPQSLQLRSGNNTIDFAYREDGTRLDKLFITSGSRTPSGNGDAATNCGTSNTPTESTTASDFWMEAECGALGGKWNTFGDSDASAGTYASFTGADHYSEPDPNVREELIHYNVEIKEEGTYYLFLRMDAANDSQNSFWVRMDTHGKWLKFWKESNGSSLRTNGLEWRRVNDDTQQVSFKLNPGTHTITVANREAGTVLDKLLLSQSSNLPSGKGSSATNCSANSSSTIMFSTMSTTPASAPVEETTAVEETTLSLYPNPAVNDLTVELTSGYEGRVDLIVIDAAGRQIRAFNLDKAGDQLRTNINVSDLPSGMYRLRVLEGNQQTIQPFVRM